MLRTCASFAFVAAISFVSVSSHAEPLPLPAPSPLEPLGMSRQIALGPAPSALTYGLRSPVFLDASYEPARSRKVRSVPMIVAGSLFTAAGTATQLTGGYLFFSSLACFGLFNNRSSCESPGLGVGLMLLGTVGLGVGIPLIVIGARRPKKTEFEPYMGALHVHPQGISFTGRF